MHERILAAGVVLMVVAILFLTAGAIPVSHGQQTVVFQTPAFLLVVALAVILLLVACFRRRPLLRQIAFALAHAGLVLLIVGALIDWRSSRRIEGVRLPVAMGHAVEKLRDTATGQMVELGFSLEIMDFSVAFYDPVYALFQPDASKPGGEAFVQKIDPRVPATLRQVPGGSLSMADLNRAGAWVQELELTNGWFLRKQPEVPRWYEASVRTTIDGIEHSWGLAVNHPLVAKGWQVMLVSYGHEPMEYVELAFKRSPGHRCVVAGIWCVIAGVSLLCLAPPLLRKARHAES
jgi:hypothetical protein